MKVNVWNTIQQLSKERGVDPSVIVSAIEESLRVAASQYFSHNEKVIIEFKPEKGDLRVYSIKQICDKPDDPAHQISLKEAKEIDAGAVVGSFVEIDLPSVTLGRIAAQAAKQVILQKVRNAEQDKIYRLFAPRMGEIVTGVLRRFEASGNMILEASKTEVLLLERDTLNEERFRRGDRIKAVITHVSREAKGPQVVVSRTDKRFLLKLLELEIPEINNGNIDIMDIVRQPGERSKVAVRSQEKDVDPIGACIGPRGNRILSISNELNGEKIDIVAWSDNPRAFAKSALSPAHVDEVFIADRRNKVLQARVGKGQFSLAIGKKGLNVRLASRLVGWKIEIKNELKGRS